MSDPKLLAKAPNIYIVGAQCTGKTTLVKALQQFFNQEDNCSWRRQEIQAPHVVVEVARGVLQKYNFTAEDITSSPAKALEMQRLMLSAQLEAEEHIFRLGKDAWFISDRSGFDPIVYAKRYAGDDRARELMASATFAALEKVMREALIVVCEAGADWLFDDGVRLMPASKEDWVGFHELFCAALDAAKLAYVVLPHTMTGHQERAQFVVKHWGQYLS